MIERVYCNYFNEDEDIISRQQIKMLDSYINVSYFTDREKG